MRTKKATPVYAVSACLVGIRCRYNGKHQRNAKVLRFLRNQRWFPVCPELLSGLPCPRPPAEIQGGDGRSVLRGKARVNLADGTEVTEAFLRGAREAWAWVKAAGGTHAILKERSPSCGARRVYQSGRLVGGKGVFAALLSRHGIPVLSEAEIADD